MSDEGLKRVSYTEWGDWQFDEPTAKELIDAAKHMLGYEINSRGHDAHEVIFFVPWEAMEEE